MRFLSLFSTSLSLFIISFLLFGGSALIPRETRFGELQMTEGGLLAGRGVVETSVLSTKWPFLVTWQWCPNRSLNSWCLAMESDFMSLDGFLQIGSGELTLADVIVDLQVDTAHVYDVSFSGLLSIDTLEFNVAAHIPQSAKIRGALDSFRIGNADFGTVKLFVGGDLEEGVKISLDNQYVIADLTLLENYRVLQKLTYKQVHPNQPVFMTLLGLKKAGDQVDNEFSLMPAETTASKGGAGES